MKNYLQLVPTGLKRKNMMNLYMQSVHMNRFISNVWGPLSARSYPTQFVLKELVFLCCKEVRIPGRDSTGLSGFISSYMLCIPRLFQNLHSEITSFYLTNQPWRSARDKHAPLVQWQCCQPQRLLHHQRFTSWRNLEVYMNFACPSFEI